ncbi:MAG TPA: hypothetical protein VLX28_15640, partial [Thermoanaerobaculia bacterium]|nr:hypothetical protein [Thermoanaerobaculia bacterium]
MNRRRALVAAVTPALLLGLQGLAYAKRDVDYEPPPYFERLWLSLVGVFPVAMLVVLVCGVIAALFTGLPKPATRKLLIVSVVLFICGSVVAAMDGLNDERWNPVLLASCFLALIPGFTLFLNSERPRPVVFVLVALVIAVPTWIGLNLLGEFWQEWASAHGIPA